MAEFKLNIADPKTGKCMQKVIAEPESSRLIGLKIGDRIDGSVAGLSGYEFIITGGSDYCGFPMRPDIPGSARKRILTRKGIGFRGKNRRGKTQRGLRVRKTVCGNTIGSKTVQINVKIVKYGTKKIEEEKKKETEAKPEEKQKQKKAE